MIYQKYFDIIVITSVNMTYSFIQKIDNDFINLFFIIFRYNQTLGKV